MEFEGAVAVITGAASGIGRSTALALAKLGTDIVVADIDDARMEEVSQAIENLGRRALIVHCDVSQDASVKNLAAQTLSAFGRVDLLMNNAGVMIEGDVEKISLADWEWVLNINLLGIIRGVHAFLPIMLKSGSGYIINTSSIAGLIPDWGSPSLAVKTIPYITSKFGVLGFSESLYTYLRPKGIMVSVLCPGGVSTNFQSNIRHAADDWQQDNDIKYQVEAGAEATGNSDLGDLMEPDEVAQIIINSIKKEYFLILTHPNSRERLVERGQYLLNL
ncbi:MAG TPA: SDR family oxidoreductase [Dehalococcoidia bacterium]|nr:SDR family oxidoreductase [Dehalococcoidia bacterium]